MESEGFERNAERYGVLEDPQRRAIYGFVRGLHRAVTREEVAGGVGVSRNLAAFHLERLLEAGLLNADYARPEGRSGPGSGRPAKNYVPSDAEITLEVPPRRYALAGRLLVRAIEDGGSRASARDAAMRIAAEEGNRLGREFADRSPGADVVAAVDLLCELGFEAVMDDLSGGVTLANCPFHALADASPQLVCGMNEALVHGLIDGLGVEDLKAVLDPGDGRCCVVLKRAGHSHGSARRDSARSVRSTVAS